MSEQPQDLDRGLAILRSVAKKTRARRLDWMERETRPGAFECDLSSGNVEIGYADNDWAAPHDFRIYGPGPDYIRVLTLSGREHPSFQNELSDLHGTVERQVKGVDQVLSAILSELDEE